MCAQRVHKVGTVLVGIVACIHRHTLTAAVWLLTYALTEHQTDASQREPACSSSARQHPMNAAAAPPIPQRRPQTSKLSPVSTSIGQSSTCQWQAHLSMAGVRYDHEYDAMYAGLGVVCCTRAQTSIATILKPPIASKLSEQEVEVRTSFSPW